MNAEVISIGDELTSGQRLDTNSRWLSQKLGELGISVLYHTTVADNLSANIQVFRQAIERADIIVCTGGLGPTADDLTRDALSEATGRELELDEASLEHINNLFARRNRPMPEKNIVQAMFPAGSRVIENPHGSAPGIDLTVLRAGNGESRIFALPGVPAEMKEMWQQTVEKRINESLSGTSRQIIRHHRIKCFGVGESDLEQMLPDVIRRGRSPSVGITVSKATITLRISAQGEPPESCYDSMKSTIKTIHDCLGNLIFGQEDDELEHATARLLSKHNSTLATTEWGTGGLLAQWLSAAPKAAEVYRGGAIICGRQDIHNLLSIPENLISQHGLHSQQVVSAMAESIRRRYQSDYALAIGQISEKTQGISTNDFHYALATPNKTMAKQSSTAIHPDILKPRSAKQALNLLRLSLIHSEKT